MTSITGLSEVVDGAADVGDGRCTGPGRWKVMRAVVHDRDRDRLRRRHGCRRRVRVTVACGMLLALGSSHPATARAQTSCVFAGPPTNVLTVSVSGRFEAVIRRRGQEIVIGDYGRAAEGCSGAIPTVTNTDTIRLVFAGLLLPSVEVLLEHGPLAPGATPEHTGASEIELEIHGSGLAVDIVGTHRNDEFRWGRRGPHTGLNVNRDDAGDKDVDIVIMGGPRPPVLYALGAAGHDVITGAAVLGSGYVHALGGSGDDVLGAPRGLRGATLAGGPGDDVLTGSRFDDVLTGGAGDDRIVGGAGADDISGGAGFDQISAGAGRDLIDVRDRADDIVSCGSGRDRVNKDRRDRVTGCERPRRR